MTLHEVYVKKQKLSDTKAVEIKNALKISCVYILIRLDQMTFFKYDDNILTTRSFVSCILVLNKYTTYEMCYESDVFGKQQSVIGNHFNYTSSNKIFL